MYLSIGKKGSVFSSRVELEFIKSGFRAKYFKISFKAEIQYNFIIQSNQKTF